MLRLVLVCAIALGCSTCPATVAIDDSPDRVRTPLRVDMRRVGTIRPVSSREARPSAWTLNCTPYDRHFGEYAQHRDYIPALGIRKFRLLGGWARCERERGKYDFAWIDEVVDGNAANGIETILETDYGNPIYPGGGGWDLAGGFPTGEEALSAWDRWVEALALHFKGRVREWAMWNEPDIANPAAPQGEPSSKTPAQIAAFNVRTARIIRRIIPDASIGALSLASAQPPYVEDCLRELVAAGGGGGLFDYVIYHGYWAAPEGVYGNVDRIRELVGKYLPGAGLRQGENGCASELATRFALGGICWSEFSQAKWNLRRMMGDHGRNIDSTVFAIADYNHLGREMNRKGLLRANADNEVIAVKRAFYAVQNAVSVFDDALRPVPSPGITNVDVTVALQEYRTDEDAPVYVYWKYGNPVRHGKGNGRYCTTDPVEPGDSFDTVPTVFDISRGEPLQSPLWVDLLTGGVYELPEAAQIVHSRGVSLVDIPLYDSPCLICERRALSGKVVWR